VLVVGAGNTGAEIALDLHEHGAKPTLAVRSPVNILPRDFLGMPTQLTSIRMSRAPLKLVDSLGRAVSWLAFGDLTRYGFGRPELGPISAIRMRQRIPLLDIGTIDAVKRGAIAVKPGVTHFTARGAAFGDGSEETFDAAILATGYRPALAEILDVPEVLDERGYPRDWKASGAAEGLYFVGYRNVPTGLLREIGLEAEAVAASVFLTKQ
jgi:cation diffusion facilitator CzcD-associated flavoprotein CzcO